MRIPRLLLALSLLLLSGVTTAPAQSVINFDGSNAGAGAVNVSEFDVLGGQYSPLGVTFTSSGQIGAQAPVGSLLPGEDELDLTQSGTQALLNSITDLDGNVTFVPIEFSFSAAVSGFSGYFVVAEGSQFDILGFDADGNSFAAITNSPVGGSLFSSFSFNVSALASVRITSSSDFILDDIQFAPLAVTAVPEPGTLLLLTISGAGVIAAYRRRKKQHAPHEPSSDEVAEE